jgi:hypothetical protein
MNGENSRLIDSSAPTKTVVVLGTMRSGTSMTAGVLSKLGVDVGKDLFDESRANPLGYFEDAAFYDLSTQIIEAAGGHRHDPPSRTSILAQSAIFRDEVTHLSKRRSNSIWGWKDPGLCLTLEAIIDGLDTPHVIVCRRDIQQSASSYDKMVGNTISDTEHLIRTYSERLDDFCTTRTDIPQMLVDHAEFVADPLRHTKRIVDFLDLDLDSRQIRLAVSHVKSKRQIRLLQASKLVQKGLRQPHLVPPYVWKRLHIAWKNAFGT